MNRAGTAAGDGTAESWRGYSAKSDGIAIALPDEQSRPTGADRRQSPRHCWSGATVAGCGRDSRRQQRYWSRIPAGSAAGVAAAAGGLAGVAGVPPVASAATATVTLVLVRDCLEH